MHRLNDGVKANWAVGCTTKRLGLAEDGLPPVAVSLLMLVLPPLPPSGAERSWVAREGWSWVLAASV